MLRNNTQIFFRSKKLLSTFTLRFMTTVNHKYTNLLIKEKSPYLLQHAHNPVQWYPWGEEAFKLAKERDVPIFLSVGYSTCHWCHVMERESFENEEIAKIMNENFVNIKVDREERPDVDRVYMTFVQATTQRGGWPMSVFLTPDLKPFFGGTYFPPSDNPLYRVIGFPSLLKRITYLWKNERKKLEESSDQIIKALQSQEEGKKDLTLFEKGKDHLMNGVITLMDEYDDKLGGFGGAPKFPRPVIFNFLFRMYKNLKSQKEDEIAKRVLDSCLFTLKQMAKGGMYDHIGGGFHRYSVDAGWHVPHFEKMLYDQAQLVISFVDAYQITKDEFYANIAREIIQYVLRDLTYNNQAFFSAEDADSLPTVDSNKKREGAFYVWTLKELESILDKDAKEGEPKPSEIFAYVFDCHKNGNVAPEHDPHHEFTGQNILIQRATYDQAAKKFKISEKQVIESIKSSKQKLFEVRKKRPRPHLDDKILTAWNGLMISALSKAAQVLGDKSFIDQAEKAAHFIRQNLYDSKRGILLRSFRESPSNIEGFLSDYAYFIQGLLDLYEATTNIDWLQWAFELQKKQNQLFEDTKNGGFFDVTGKDKSILVRMKEDYDGAEPSPNSISAMNLLRFGQMLHIDEMRKIAQNLLLAFSTRIAHIPHAVPQLMCAFDQFLNEGKTIVFVYKRETKNYPDDSLIPYLKAIQSNYNPSKTLVFWEKNNEIHDKFFGKYLEFLKEEKAKEKPTVFICEKQTCQLPITDVAELVEKLQ